MTPWAWGFVMGVGVGGAIWGAAVVKDRDRFTNAMAGYLVGEIIGYALYWIGVGLYIAAGGIR